jgi:hypothetical protein
VSHGKSAQDVVESGEGREQGASRRPHQQHEQDGRWQRALAACPQAREEEVIAHIADQKKGRTMSDKDTQLDRNAHAEHSGHPDHPDHPEHPDHPDPPKPPKPRPKPKPDDGRTYG